MIAAIHQPNYLPWLGFFDKMRRVDVFVYLDMVAFSRGDYQNRTRIKTAEGASWLTVPVRTTGRLGQRTDEVELDARGPWGRKHLARIDDAYRGCPGLDWVHGSLADVLVRPWSLLVDLNLALLERVRDMLTITTPTLRASALGVEGSSSELLRQICAAVGAHEYLAGPGSRAYLDVGRLADAGIAVREHEFRHPTYPQPHGIFVPGLSVIDMLCVEAERARGILRS